MRARRNGETGYWCESCDETHTSFDTRTVYFVSNYDTVHCDNCDDSHFTDYSIVDGWECESGNFRCNDSAPSIGDLWICGECDTVHADREMAGNCCQ